MKTTRECRLRNLTTQGRPHSEPLNQ